MSACADIGGATLVLPPIKRGLAGLVSPALVLSALPPAPVSLSCPSKTHLLHGPWLQEEEEAGKRENSFAFLSYSQWHSLSLPYS